MFDLGDDISCCSPTGSQETHFSNEICSHSCFVPSYSYDPGGFLSTAACIMQQEEPIHYIPSKTEPAESFETTAKDWSKPSNEYAMLPLPMQNKFGVAELYPQGVCEMKRSYLKSNSFSQISNSSSNSCTNSFSTEEEEQSYNAEMDVVETVDKQSDSVERRLPRALNAYNYFFRDEKENLMKGVYGPDGSFPQPSEDWSEGKKWKLLLEHWFTDPFKGRRKHRKKGGGTIPFLTLARLVSARWKDLPIQGRLFYDEVARLDFLHYQLHQAEGTCEFCAKLCERVPHPCNPNGSYEHAAFPFSEATTVL